MNDKHKLCLYVSYYLARFNNEALNQLGYETWNIAFNDIGEKLDVKPNSVRNRRDEFDPLFTYRAGWHQREMSPSRIKVAQALENLDEIQIRSIVKDILSGRLKENSGEKEQLLSIVSERPLSYKRGFVLRTPTGKAAEEYFIEYQKKFSEPESGELIDCRDLGCGYDFKIRNPRNEKFIEVKGIADFLGGILFTDKEWRIATEMQNDYFLCIVSGVKNSPQIKFIQNPVLKFNPKKNIITTIQINWSLTNKQLAEAE